MINCFFPGPMKRLASYLCCIHLNADLRPTNFLTAIISSSTLCWTFETPQMINLQGWLPHSWILFSVGLFWLQEQGHPTLLRKHKRIGARTCASRCARGTGVLIQRFQLYFSAVPSMLSDLIFSLCSSSQAGSKRLQNTQLPNYRNNIWKKVRSFFNTDLRIR